MSAPAPAQACGGGVRVPLSVGVTVELTGLTSADLNGQVGTIAGPQRSNGRWPVALPTQDKPLAVKALNLVARGSAPRAGAGVVTSTGVAAADAGQAVAVDEGAPRARPRPRVLIADAATATAEQRVSGGDILQAVYGGSGYATAAGAQAYAEGVQGWPWQIDNK